MVCFNWSILEYFVPNTGSQLGPALSCIFMCGFKSKWPRDCTNDFKPMFYRRYVDVIFVPFSFPDYADKFK